MTPLSYFNVLLFIMQGRRNAFHRFEHLLRLGEPKIAKQDTKFRLLIKPEERLVITLCFLACGEDQQILSFSFRIGKSTVSMIIAKTTEAIYSSLRDEYLKVPCTSQAWLEISKDFENIWNFPYCVGALDGKHIKIQCPRLSGSLYHNCKGFFNIVVLAACFAKYCFTLFDLGQYGSNNDSGLLMNPKMTQLFQNEKLNISSLLHINNFPINTVP